MFCAIPTIKTELLAFLVFALLVSNSATGLASGLAGSLAFAASAILCAFAKVTGFDCFDTFHFGLPPIKSLCFIITLTKNIVKTKVLFFNILS